MMAFVLTVGAYGQTDSIDQSQFVVAYDFVTNMKETQELEIIRMRFAYNTATFPMVLRREETGHPIRAMIVEKVRRSRVGTSSWYVSVAVSELSDKSAESKK